MATIPTKIIRIQNDEKEFLSRLREIYANDYKKYSEHIRRESNVPISIKRIYKLLDERKAYRRISDYFHRERKTKTTRASQSNGIKRSYHRSSKRGITQVNKQSSIMPVEDDQQQFNSPTMTNGSNEEQNPFPSVLNSTHQRINSPSPSSIPSKPDLLPIRTSIQKALCELDRAIILQSNKIPSEDYSDEQQYRSLTAKAPLLINNYRHSKLDDIVQSLSNVVHRQQENTRLISNESSSLLVDNDQQSVRLSKTTTTTQESIKHFLERLTTLIDRGHSIYERLENILTEFEHF